MYYLGDGKYSHHVPAISDKPYEIDWLSLYQSSNGEWVITVAREVQELEVKPDNKLGTTGWPFDQVTKIRSFEKPTESWVLSVAADEFLEDYGY